MHSINWSRFNDLWDDFWPIEFNDRSPKVILERARRFHFAKQLSFEFPEGPGGTYFFGDGTCATNVWLKDIDYSLPFNQSGQMEFVMFQEFNLFSEHRSGGSGFRRRSRHSRGCRNTSHPPDCLREFQSRRPADRSHASPVCRY